jgi:hypothetical protein
LARSITSATRLKTMNRKQVQALIGRTGILKTKDGLYIHVCVLDAWSSYGNPKVTVEATDKRLGEYQQTEIAIQASRIIFDPVSQ